MALILESFTANMLVSCGVDFALVGHSERRADFGESDEIVAKKFVDVLMLVLAWCFAVVKTLLREMREVRSR